MNAWVLVACLAVMPGLDVGRPFRAGDEGDMPGLKARPTANLEVGGDVLLSADVFPSLDAGRPFRAGDVGDLPGLKARPTSSPTASPVTEFRPRASLDLTARLSDAVRVKLEGFGEALVADRSGTVTDAAIRVREAWMEVAGDKGDLRFGYGRLVWGRLDEVQPSDVINPLDTARYLFDGRSEARRAVAFVRGRAFASDRLVVEGVFAPIFRRGVFDELDEPSSPFNLLNDEVLPAGLVLSSDDVRRETPATTWSNVSGGGRVSATVGRVDVAGAVYRGFEGFGLVSFEPSGAPQLTPPVVGTLVERFPRFTMVSGDFETVVGEWALRGEAAMFVEKTLQSRRGAPAGVDGRAFDAGVGFDRRTGDFRVYGSLLVRREWSDVEPELARTDVTLVGSIERAFARDRYLARVFGVTTPADGSGFLRGLFVWKLRDAVAIEASAAAFLGSGDTTLARFEGRDFLLTRLRYRW